MKYRTVYTTFFVVVMAVTAMTAVAGQAVSGNTRLVVHIMGFENSDGIAKVAVVDSKKSFEDGPLFKGYNFDIRNNEVTAVIQLPYGEYAIKVIHDENSNNELDRRIFGIPVERYGFSNDARASFGPPEYDAAKFELDSPEKEMTITIQ